MSEFKCEVVRVTIETHPNADAIEIAKVGDYQSIVKKGQFKTGDLAVYIPEQAILPEWLLKVMGFWDEARQKGMLNGAAGNRVKAIKLRGVLSQGVTMSFIKGGDGVLGLPCAGEHPELGVAYDFTFFPEVKEGDDFAEYLGVTKFEPSLPCHMRCKIAGVDWENTHNYDFDNLKKKPTLFDDGEEVVITEKIHGTFIQIGVVPSKDANEKYFEGRVVVSSKGMGAKGFVLDHTDEGNLYARAAKKHGLFEAMLETFGAVADREGKPVFICGEVFGKAPGGANIQDLTYTDTELDFRAFDICIGNRGTEKYMPWDDFVAACSAMKVPTVPLLYVGPYSKHVVLAHTDGNTTLTTKKQIREGVVVKSAVESIHPHLGRKIAKSVSEKYLLRKGEVTEFN